MRKVDFDNITKPTIKIIMQVYLPYNDGSNSGEVTEAYECAFLDESSNDLMKLCKNMMLDSKQIAHHHEQIMRLKKPYRPATPAAAAAEKAQPTGLDKLDPGVELPAPKVTIKKSAGKKAKKK